MVVCCIGDVQAKSWCLVVLNNYKALMDQMCACGWLSGSRKVVRFDDEAVAQLEACG